MRAMRLHEYKQPLRLDDVELQRLGPKDAVIKITACGVCHTDVYLAVRASTKIRDLLRARGHSRVGWKGCLFF